MLPLPVAQGAEAASRLAAPPDAGGPHALRRWSERRHLGAADGRASAPSRLGGPGRCGASRPRSDHHAQSGQSARRQGAERTIARSRPHRGGARQRPRSRRFCATRIGNAKRRAYAPHAICRRERGPVPFRGRSLGARHRAFSPEPSSATAAAQPARAARDVVRVSRRLCCLRRRPGPPRRASVRRESAIRRKPSGEAFRSMIS